MKKILTAITLLTSTYLANAQREGLWIAPQFTIGGGTMTDVFPTAYSPDATAIFNIGVDGYYMFGNHFGVGTGVNYGAYAYQWTGNSLQLNGTQIKMDVPVYLRLVSCSRGGGFFAQFGLMNSILLSAEETIKQGGTETKFTGREGKEGHESYSISPFVYFGGSIRCGNKVNMTLGPIIQYQLSNNFTSDSGLEGHYLLFGFKMGVGIHAVSFN